MKTYIHQELLNWISLDANATNVILPKNVKTTLTQGMGYYSFGVDRVIFDIFRIEYFGTLFMRAKIPSYYIAKIFETDKGPHLIRFFDPSMHKIRHDLLKYVNRLVYLSNMGMKGQKQFNDVLKLYRDTAYEVKMLIGLLPYTHASVDMLRSKRGLTNYVNYDHYKQRSQYREPRAYNAAPRRSYNAMAEGKRRKDAAANNSEVNSEALDSYLEKLQWEAEQIEKGNIPADAKFAEDYIADPIPDTLETVVDTIDEQTVEEKQVAVQEASNVVDSIVDNVMQEDTSAKEINADKVSDKEAVDMHNAVKSGTTSNFGI